MIKTFDEFIEAANKVMTDANLEKFIVDRETGYLPPYQVIDLVRIVAIEVNNVKQDLVEALKQLQTAIEIIKDQEAAIAELKKSAMTNKLLIEHEENIRSTKPTRTRAKKASLKIKRGDIVHRIKDETTQWNTKHGKVLKVNGDRAYVEFADQKSWVAIRSLTFSVPKRT